MKRMASPKWHYCLSFLIIACLLVGCYEEEQIITPSDALNAKAFGTAVDIFGEFALVGDKQATRRRNGETMVYAGSAHLYHYDGTEWIERANFGATVPEWDGEFGASVAMSNNFAIVGAPGETTNGIKKGAVYILRRYGNSWHLFQKFVSPFNERNCFFGQSVDIYGTYAIVGAPLADTSRGSNTGAAAIYHFNGAYWSRDKIVAGHDSSSGDWFGLSVKISGNYAVVGAPYDNTQRGTDGGSAYVFKQSTGWGQSDKLVPRGSFARALAGYSVGMNHNYVILGAPHENNERGSGAGAIYIFVNQNGNCEQVSRFVPPGSGLQYFGYAVDMIDQVAVVGAPRSYHNAGMLHVFGLNAGSWLYLAELIGSQAVSADRPEFGTSVAANGEYAIFGAPGQKNDNGLETGGAYVFIQEEY